MDQLGQKKSNPRTSVRVSVGWVSAVLSFLFRKIGCIRSCEQSQPVHTWERSRDQRGSRLLQMGHAYRTHLKSWLRSLLAPFVRLLLLALGGSPLRGGGVRLLAAAAAALACCTQGGWRSEEVKPGIAADIVTDCDCTDVDCNCL